jgi:hypothetical protein
MHSITKYILIYILLLFLAGPVFADIQVIAQLGSNGDIYVGENFPYNIIIDGDNKEGQVDISPLSQYNPKSAGKRDVSQTSVSIINGRTSQNVIKRFVMSYTLSINQKGTVTLPPVSVTVDGKIYKTNSLQVNILEPGTTDKLELEVSLSEQKCYVGQPVIMTVNFYIMANVGDFQFNIPAFTNDLFTLEDPDVTNTQAKAYDVGNGVIVWVTQARTNHNGKDSILLSFSEVLIPKKSGDIEIAPSSVSVDIATGRARSSGGFPDDSFFDSFFGSQQQYQRFMVKSQPLKLSVLPLPNAEQPAGFYGLVGKYTISASATPTKVNVGDPITLSISIGGNKYLKPVQWPALEHIPELVQNFKIPSQKASPTIQNDSKIFTQTIRAGNDKVTEIPSIPLVFFDSQTGRYITAKTEPIKLDVSPSKVLTSADIEGLDAEPVVKKEVEAIKKGLSANYETLDALKNQGFSPVAAMVQPGYLVIWVSPLCLLIISAAARILNNKTPEKIIRSRRKSAAGKAIKELRKFVSSPGIQHEQLAMIMKNYIGERFDKTAAALTSNDCYDAVFSSTQDIHIAGKFKDIVADCEAARYSSANNNVEQAKLNEVIELIETIEKK